MKTVSCKEEFPSGRHFGVFTYSTIHIPGDERSRTHPGHGYAASTENVIHYQSFSSSDEMKKWVSENADKSFSLVETLPLKVEVQKHIIIS